MANKLFYYRDTIFGTNVLQLLHIRLDCLPLISVVVHFLGPSDNIELQRQSSQSGVQLKKQLSRKSSQSEIQIKRQISKQLSRVSLNRQPSIQVHCP